MNRFAVTNLSRRHKSFLLAACVYLLLAVGVSRFGPSRQILHFIHADSTKIYPPGKVVHDYWGNPWDASGFNPFDGFISLQVLIFATVYMLMICFIGRAIIASFLGNHLNLPQIPFLFAGFLIGYTTVLLPLRIVYALLPVRIGSVLIFICLISLCIKSIKTTPMRTSQPSILFSGFLIVMCIFIAFIYRVQSGRNFLVSDSNINFLNVVKLFKTTKNGLDFLPTWDQQSDEWFFTAPGVFLFESSRYDAIWYLLTASFGQLSLFFSVYLFSLNSFRKVSTSQWLRLGAWVPSCLIFFSTPSWLPSGYVSLFGGQNPVIYLGHAGRYVGLILPCILVFLFEQKSFDRDKTHLLQFLFFAGIGFMSIHLAFYFILIGFILTFIKPIRSRGQSKPTLRSLTLIPHKKLIFSPALAGLLSVYVFNHRDVSPGVTSSTEILSWTSIILLFGSCMSLFLYKVSIRDVPVKLGLFAHFRRYIFYGLALFTGFILSGNTLLTFEPFRDGYRWVGSVFPSFLIDPYTRGVGAVTPFNVLRFSGTECWMTGHCLSVWGFIGAYGIVILLASIALILFPTNGEQSTINETLFALSLILFPLMFFIVDFTGGTELISSWVKTRFLEPAYYCLLVLSWLSVAKIHKYRGLFLVISALWFLPLIVMRVSPQIVANFVWVFKQVI
jgi:hypothetical protein